MIASDFSPLLAGPDSPKESLKDFSKKNQARDHRQWPSAANWLLSLVGLLAVAYGLVSLYREESCQVVGAVDDQAQFSASVSSSLRADPYSFNANALYVDISGGVNQPGVHALAAQSRVSDAIQAAGGLSQAADQTYVTEQLNLAAKLEDGQKIHIQTQAETKYQESLQELCQLQVEKKENQPMSNGSSSQDKVSINQASAAELEDLNQVGEKRAADIIAGRPYQQLEQLVSQEILSQSVYDKIKNQLKL